VWRCFDNIRETFEEKGWESRFGERNDNEAMPLLAESDNYWVVFFERDPGTVECRFELCDKVRRSVVFVRGAQNISTPEQATKLLAHHGVPSYEITAFRNRPLYSLPVVPVIEAASPSRLDLFGASVGPVKAEGIDTNSSRYTTSKVRCYKSYRKSVRYASGVLLRLRTTRVHSTLLCAIYVDYASFLSPNLGWFWKTPETRCSTLLGDIKPSSECFLAHSCNAQRESPTRYSPVSTSRRRLRTRT
jgi:hypothetical protein